MLFKIDIPGQIEKNHWLSFTQFEKHLYARILEYFKESRSNQLAVFESLDSTAKLDVLDRDTLNKVINFLK